MKRVKLILGTLALSSAFYMTASSAQAQEVQTEPISSSEEETTEEETQFDPIITISEDLPEGIIPNNIFIGDIDLGGKTTQEAQEIIEDYVADLMDFSVTITVGEEDYELSAEDAGLVWINQNLVEDAANYIQDGNFVVRYKRQKDIDQAPVVMEPVLKLNEKMLVECLTEFVGEWESEPVEPSAVRSNGQIVVTPGQNGYTYEQDTAVKALSKLYSETDADKRKTTYEIPVTVVEPSLPADIFSHFSAKPLGECTTTNLAYPSRKNNIQLAARNISNSRIYMPGEQVSLLELLGPVTEAAGYQKAGGYENGRTVQVVGGGVCQVATTLHVAALYAEMQIDFRRAHSMGVSYVPPAMDATVVPNGGNDFTFTNNTAYPIYIEAFTGDDSLTIRIYGCETRDPNREIRFRSDATPAVDPSPLYIYSVDNTANKVGRYGFADKYTQISEPHQGVSATSYKEIWVNGVKQSETKLYSDSYRKSPGEITHASDCKVIGSRRADGSLFLDCQFMNGVTWNPDHYDANINSSGGTPDPTEPEESTTNPEVTEPEEPATTPEATEPEVPPTEPPTEPPTDSQPAEPDTTAPVPVEP